MRSDPNSPIILYLPPGPVISLPEPAFDVASVLSDSTSAIVVQVNYRLSRNHKYPICIHDVLRGYDWVIEHLLPARAFQRPGRSAWHPTPIAACGELVGGGLATMLALTESRLTGPRVTAAAINEPLVDWVFPEEHHKENKDDAIDFDGDFGVKPVTRESKRKQRKIIPSFHTFARNGVLNADTLLGARSSYFHQPADYFDPFASSTLFFRTAGAKVPPAPIVPTLDEFGELARFEREDFHRQQLRLSSIGIAPDETTAKKHSDAMSEAMEPARKTYKRWPTAASGLSIPAMRISFGDTSPLSDQAVELAMLLRRSAIMQKKKEAYNEEQAEKQREEAFVYAERQAEIHAMEGIRFWSGGSQTTEIRRVAQWLRQVLE